MPDQREQASGRADCLVCCGAGCVDRYPGYLTGEREACPHCLWIDKQLYGVAFIYKDRRIDPAEVQAVPGGVDA